MERDTKTIGPDKRSRLLLALAVVLILSLIVVMSDAAEHPDADSGVYIVYTEGPPALEKANFSEDDFRQFHLQTLSSVLGSKEAADESMVYVYKNVLNGYAAKLTAAQVEELKKQPGVLQVVPNQNLSLHSNTGNMMHV